MAKKSKSVKIDGIEIRDHRTSFMTAFVIALIAFSTGVLAYHYIFMILPQKPGCVQIMVKDVGNKPIPDVEVKILVIVINETGKEVASGLTNTQGRVKFCDMFQPKQEYLVIINDQYGKELWVGSFTTNEKSTADFPIIVKSEAQ